MNPRLFMNCTKQILDSLGSSNKNETFKTFFLLFPEGPTVPSANILDKV